MVDLYAGTVPNLTQNQPDFDTNTQGILDYIASLATQLNEWEGAYVQDTKTVSSTEHTLGTGSKVFTVEAGKGYKEDMTVRASAGGGNFMDGNVTAYSGTSLTVNFTNYNGSGTFDDWDIYLNISGGATLESNTFSGDQFVPDEAYDSTTWDGNLSVPTKNAIRDKLEQVISDLPQVKFTKEYISSQQVITSGGSLTLAHSLGVTPKLIQLFLVPQSSVDGYTSGREIPIPNNAIVNGIVSRGAAVEPDATNINVRFGSDVNAFILLSLSTAALVTITNSNYKLLVKAWA